MSTTSLNRMVLNALTALTATQSHVTSREIKVFLQTTYQACYQIQTIIVVLNRFRERGLVQRATLSGKESRERYGYYLSISSAQMRQSVIRERFQALADEFFDGSTEQALQALSGLSANPGSAVSRPDL